MTAAARQACAVLYEAGWPIEAVALLADCHPVTVWRNLQAEGVELRGRWR